MLRHRHGWPERPAAPAYRSGGQYLGLLALELLGRDDSLVTQVGQLGQLVGRGRRTGGILDVGAEVLLLPLGILLRPLLHLAATGDQVDQDADQRDEQHEQEPHVNHPVRCYEEMRVRTDEWYRVPVG